jgi:hypothetical protein
MKPHFILVDFENVQPRNLGTLKDGQHKVRVFLGASQTKITLELAQALQAFGPDAKYVQISGNGTNALDFHIAFYIGRLSALHPEASFTIVSRDTGFDPLIKHLAARGIQCRRSPTLSDTAVAKPPAKATVATKPAAAPKRTASREATRPAAVDARLALVLENLGNMKANRPRTVKSLGSSIRSWFKPPLDDKALAALLDQLTKAGKIKVDGTKVGYALG